MREAVAHPIRSPTPASVYRFSVRMYAWPVTTATIGIAFLAAHPWLAKVGAQGFGIPVSNPFWIVFMTLAAMVGLWGMGHALRYRVRLTSDEIMVRRFLRKPFRYRLADLRMDAASPSVVMGRPPEPEQWTLTPTDAPASPGIAMERKWFGNERGATLYRSLLERCVGATGQAATAQR